MKRKTLFVILFILVFSICSCIDDEDDSSITNNDGISDETINSIIEDTSLNVVYDNSTLSVSKVSGTDCYTISESTITFGTISENTEYNISGNFTGNIIVDCGDDYEFTLNLCGLVLNCSTTNPIEVKTCDTFSLSAKKDTTNYIFDNREKISDDDEEHDKGAIYAETDMDVKGKGNLIVASKNNNGIHSKDNLNIKNLTLTVVSCDNAVKGNDKLEVESGTLKLIATTGDTLKTSNSELSNKGKQKGDIIISGGKLSLYAATDGIDAAHDVIINEDDASVDINIYTDKYSDYSDTITYASSKMYLRVTTTSDVKTSTKFAIMFYNTTDDYKLVTATYKEEVTSQQMGGPRGGSSSQKTYVYQLDKPSDYKYLQIMSYGTLTIPTTSNYTKASRTKSVNDSYDEIDFSYSSTGFSTISWTSYNTASRNQMGGMGGFSPMNEGNSEKNDYSSKGIKSDNEISISSGTINIKSYDDCIHANSDNELESGVTPTGNVTISGGTLSLYSNDDGIHGDGISKISGGTIKITHAYEGVEGNTIIVSGGDISVISTDDGFNSTATTVAGITLSGGSIYIIASGDGIDSNTQTQYQGIIFSGANVVVVCNSNNNSSIDTERGYTYTSGYICAIGGGMSSQESTNCSNFSTYGTRSQSSINRYITVNFDNATVLADIGSSTSGVIILLGGSSRSITSAKATTQSNTYYCIWQDN